MNATNDKLLTPIYLKLTSEMPWPEHEKVFHLLSRDGLFICRNHPFFRSSAPTHVGPAELAPHEPSLRLSYPRVPQRLFEKIIGFFARIGMKYGAEAAVLLAWNRDTNALEVIVPEQTSIVSSNWTVRPYPIEVHYEIPPLPPHLMLVGDLHSHGCEDPYFSTMDKQDDLHRPGLHVVVGNVDRELPLWLLEVVVEGTRFKVNDASLVIEGFERRRMHEVPLEWEQKVKITNWSGYYKSGSGQGSFSDRDGGHGKTSANLNSAAAAAASRPSERTEEGL